MTARRFAACAYLVWLASSCGESNGVGDSANGGPDSSSSGAASTTSGSTGSKVSLVDLPTAYGEAYCSWVYRCCPSEQLAHLADASVNFTGTTEEECRTNMAALLTLLVPGFTASETAGRLMYDPSLAESCIAQLETSCPTSDALCDRIAEPLVMPGDACSEDAHCIESWCIGDSDEADGTCGPLVELGGACQSDGDCLTDECSGEVCVEKTGAGETCFVDAACLSNYCDFATNQCSEAPYSGACEL